MSRSVSELDTAPAEEARQALGACCGATAWVDGMLARRPLGSLDALLRAADDVWSRLSERDWREAFAHHPRIGERQSAADTTVTAREWSSGEQEHAMGSSDDALVALGEAQRAYEARFGHIFLICAAGRSASEILATLRERMHNEPAAELRVAADEQRKITRLRLEKLVRAAPPAISHSP